MVFWRAEHSSHRLTGCSVLQPAITKVGTRIRLELAWNQNVNRFSVRAETGGMSSHVRVQMHIPSRAVAVSSSIMGRKALQDLLNLALSYHPHAQPAGGVWVDHLQAKHSSTNFFTFFTSLTFFSGDCGHFKLTQCATASWTLQKFVEIHDGRHKTQGISGLLGSLQIMYTTLKTIRLAIYE